MNDPTPFESERTNDRPLPEELTLAVFNADIPERALEELAASLSDCFGVDDLTVGETVGGNDGDEFAVVHDGVTVDGALLHADENLDDVVGLRPTDTVFVAGYGDRSRLRSLSQRIEKLAWRAGAGKLYVTGYQRLSTMEDQWDIYAGIADAGAEVIVYDNPEWTPEDERFSVYPGRHDLADAWLVAFDGAGNDAAKGALYVEEREPDGYYGIWTVEPAIVDAVIGCVASPSS